MNSNYNTRDQNQSTVWYFWFTYCQQQIAKTFITKFPRITEKCLFDNKVTSLQQTRKDSSQQGRTKTISAMTGKRNIFALVLAAILVSVCLLW